MAKSIKEKRELVVKQKFLEAIVDGLKDGQEENFMKIINDTALQMGAQVLRFGVLDDLFERRKS